MATSVINASNGSREKTRPDKNRHPVRVIRNGAIAASVWRRQTSAGFQYLDFSLSRSWKLKCQSAGKTSQ